MSQRQWLERAAKTIRKRLEKSPVHKEGIDLSVPLNFVETNTDGFRVDVARLFRRKDVYLELWVDRYPGGLRFYYGLGSSDKRLFKKLRASPNAWRKPVRVDQWKDTITHSGVVQLRNPITSDEIDKTVIDDFPGYSFYGVYSSANVGLLVRTRKHPARLISAVTEYFAGLTSVVGGITSDEHKGLSATEQKKLAHEEKVERWARDRGLAEECKIRDNYTCQVCRFNPNQKYRELRSTESLQAHHLTPLAARNSRQSRTTLNHLITLCANCHAAVHSPGLNGDVNALKKRLRT